MPKQSSNDKLLSTLGKRRKGSHIQMGTVGDKARGALDAAMAAAGKSEPIPGDIGIPSVIDDEVSKDIQTKFAEYRTRVDTISRNVRRRGTILKEEIIDLKSIRKSLDASTKAAMGARIPEELKVSIFNTRDTVNNSISTISENVKAMRAGQAVPEAVAASEAVEAAKAVAPVTTVAPTPVVAPPADPVKALEPVAAPAVEAPVAAKPVKIAKVKPVKATAAAVESVGKMTGPYDLADVSVDQGFYNLAPVEQATAATPTGAKAAASTTAKVSTEAAGVAEAAGETLAKTGIKRSMLQSARLGGRRAILRIGGRALGPRLLYALPYIGEAVMAADLAMMGYDATVGSENRQNQERAIEGFKAVDRLNVGFADAAEQKLSMDLDRRDRTLEEVAKIGMFDRLRNELELGQIIEQNRRSVGRIAVRQPPSAQELMEAML